MSYPIPLDMKKTFPTLYKRSATGAIQQWTISVYVQGFHENADPDNVIETVYGQVGGALQTTKDIVREGKNVGKKNETTPLQQACLEAEAKWEKKKSKERYVESLERAEAGENDAEGGIPPMLAKPYEDGIHKIKFPCDYQHKLNGIRCLAVIDEGVCTLWTRKQKPIYGVPHIQKAYEDAFRHVGGHHVFDGELYRHGWSLQKIGGFVRKKNETKEGYREISHYVYDIPSEETSTWVERHNVLATVFGAEGALKTAYPAIRLHETTHVHAASHVEGVGTVWSMHNASVMAGYEGGILRNHHAKYEPGKRSSNLVKVKDFKEEEFEIVSFGEGRGRMTGKAVFVCKTEEGKEFECTAPGTMEDKAEYFRRGNELIGKMLTVKYFERTEDNKPSHGVGVCVRDYE